MNIKFKEMGNYWIQMGLYISTIDPVEFEERKDIKENMINFLMQSYLYLQNYKVQDLIETQDVCTKEKIADEKVYLSRKQLIKEYSPLFTEYGLTQAIHIKGLPHIKRGNKYFFNKSEIEQWIADNQENSGNKRIKYV